MNPFRSELTRPKLNIKKKKKSITNFTGFGSLITNEYQLVVKWIRYETDTDTDPDHSDTC